jgi:hypothetical protein
LNQIPLSTGLLPHNTLFWGQAGGQEQIAIYVPPRQWRTIAYERHYRLPMPGMVFLGQERQYTVFAVKQKPKTPETLLYHLPAPNVGENGRICLGQAPFPVAGRDTIYDALKLFMDGYLPFSTLLAKSQRSSQRRKWRYTRGARPVTHQPGSNSSQVDRRGRGNMLQMSTC